MRVLRLALLPWWIVQIFTPAKSFRDNPVLGSRTLNGLGLHAARYALGHGITWLRRRMLSPLADARLRREYHQNGFVILHDFLPPDAFERVRKEVERCNGAASEGEVRECVQGDTATWMMLLDDRTLAELPATRALLRDRRLNGLMMYIAARLKRPLFLTHTVHNSFTPAHRDPQKDFHSDTFHSTMKAWYFVCEVRPEDGPFTYIPGSHRFSRRRMAWEHELSRTGANLENSYSSRGSFRLTEADRARLGYAEPVDVAVPANTLVIADTHGFHRRGDAVPGATRVAIYASSRSNPFNPLPGLLPGLVGRVEAMGLKASWQLADRKAAAKGGLPSWRKVNQERLTELGSRVSGVLRRGPRSQSH